MPKVSVVIATYNRAYCLPQAIASALNQTLRDIEVIVVDDGSTDNTREVVAGFDDGRISYIYQENQGRPAALNAAIERSSGEYIGKMDSDDWYLPTGLELLAKKLEECSQTGVAAGGYLMMDEAGVEIKTMQPWLQYPCLDTSTWLFASPAMFQAALVRRDWVERVGGFDVSITGPDDWDFGLRLAYAGCEMSWVREPVSCYRLHGGMSMRSISKVRSEIPYILDKFFAGPNIPPELAAIKNDVYCHGYLTVASREYAAGQVEDAKQDLAHAIRLDPSLLADEGKLLVTKVAGWAQCPIATTDPVLFVKVVSENLPELASGLTRFRRRVLAELAAARLFAAYRTKDWRMLRRSACNVALNYPARFDRGIAAVCLESIMGTRMAQLTKKSLRHILGCLSGC